MIPALFPFSGIPAHLLPETTTIVVLVLGLLINLVALGWIPPTIGEIPSDTMP